MLFYSWKITISSKMFPCPEKIALAFMNAVTPRTAGFNNVEMTSLPVTFFFNSHSLLIIIAKFIRL